MRRLVLNYLNSSQIKVFLLHAGFLMHLDARSAETICKKVLICMEQLYKSIHYKYTEKALKVAIGATDTQACREMTLNLRSR